MTNNFRVFNQTRGYSMKFRQAEKAVENCACAWVEYGVSIRDLTLAEAIAARNKQAHDRAPMPLVELHGLQYDPAEGREALAREEMRTAWEANKFAAEAAA